MKEWLAENWPYLAVAIVYVLERSQSISGKLAAKIRALVSALSRVDNLHMDSAGKDAARAEGLNHDPDVDIALDTVKPEGTARVSKGKRFLRGALKVLPILDRFMP